MQQLKWLPKPLRRGSAVVAALINRRTYSLELPGRGIVALGALTRELLGLR